MSVREDAEALLPEIVNLRHRIHEEPEIGLDLPATQEKVLAALDGLGLEVTVGKSCSSVTAVLRGGMPTRAERPVVLLRADMDALPVQETSGVAFASHNPGVMHACGHDLHVAMLAGAAQLLAARREELAGDVVFMFQPGEEGWDGASLMIEDGVLKAAGRPVDVAYGMHVYSSAIPHGTFATRPGVILSASDALSVTVRGVGGHGSAPHKAKDPVQAAAEMVTALQVMVTRQFDMFDPVVITVGHFTAGSKRNVIPETAYFEATVRTFSEESREKMSAILPQLLQGIATAHGVTAQVEYESEYPMTVTDVAETERVEKWVRELFGEQALVRMPNPLSGSEDFSRVLAKVPGTYVCLGAVPLGDDYRTAAFNHSGTAVFDDDVLADGTALYAELALRRLAELSADLDPVQVDRSDVRLQVG